MVALVASAIGFALIGVLAIRAALVSSALLIAAARIVSLGVAGGPSACVPSWVPLCRHRPRLCSCWLRGLRAGLPCWNHPDDRGSRRRPRWPRLPTAIRPCCALGFALVRESDLGRSSRRSSTRPHSSPMPRRRGIASCLIACHRAPRTRRAPPRDAYRASPRLACRLLEETWVRSP